MKTVGIVDVLPRMDTSRIQFRMCLSSLLYARALKPRKPKSDIKEAVDTLTIKEQDFFQCNVENGEFTSGDFKRHSGATGFTA